MLTDKRIVVKYFPGNRPPRLQMSDQTDELDVPLADIASVHAHSALSWNPGRVVLHLRDGRERGFNIKSKLGEAHEKGRDGRTLKDPDGRNLLSSRKWLALIERQIKLSGWG
jgi:hypothetical protein